MVEAHLNVIRNATTPEELASHIRLVVEANDVHAFAEFLSEPSVDALKKDPKFAKYHNLLQLFAYGL